jgi:3-oxoacyl-(acyl-carrier-protein) synthase
MGVAASRIAVDDAKLDLATVDGERFGVVVGSAFGGLQTLETQIKNMNEKGPGAVSPFAVPMLLSNLISGVIALENGAKGTSLPPFPPSLPTYLSTFLPPSLPPSFPPSLPPFLPQVLTTW